jgi:ribonuclease HI
MTVAYTDGACQGNGTARAVAGIGVYFPESGKEISEPLPGVATNQRAELWAAARALQESQGPVEIRTDSSYLVKGMQSWVSGWQRKGWKNSKGAPVANQDLWEELIRLAKGRSVKWTWVEGHSGNAGNERADQLAVAGCTGCNGSAPQKVSKATSQEAKAVNLVDTLSDWLVKTPREQAAKELRLLADHLDAKE